MVRSSRNLHRPARGRARDEAPEGSTSDTSSNNATKGTANPTALTHARNADRASLFHRPVQRGTTPPPPEPAFSDSLRSLRKSPLDSLQEIARAQRPVVGRERSVRVLNIAPPLLQPKADEPATEEDEEPDEAEEVEAPEDSADEEPEANNGELVIEASSDESGEEIWEVSEEALSGAELADSRAHPSSHEERLLDLEARLRGRTSEATRRGAREDDGALEEALTPLLQEVRTALDENRASQVQSEALIRDLAREVQNVSQRHIRSHRGSVLQSAVSYILFCVVISGALYYIFDSRMETDTANHARHTAELSEYEERLDIAEAELARYRASNRSASEIYELVGQGRHQEAIARFVELQDTLINPTEGALLREKMRELRWKLAEDAYREAITLFRNKEYERARDGFFKSLSFEEDTPFAHLLNYHLGMALFELSDFEGARRYLDIALTVGDALPEELLTTSKFHRALATYKVGLRDDAEDLFRLFLKQHRGSVFYNDSEDYIDTIKRERAREQRAARVAARERAEAREKAKDDD